MKSKVTPEDVFLGSEPPHVWISRAVNPPSREIFQHAFRRGGVEFFLNNPIQAAPDTAHVNHFFPHEFIIWFKSIQVKQVPRDFIAHSVTAWPLALKLASLTLKNFWEINL